MRIHFLVFYVVLETNTQLLGLAMGGALAMLAAAAIVAGKRVVPQETSVEQRDELLEEPQVEEVVEIIEAGGDGISRRVLLTGAADWPGWPSSVPRRRRWPRWVRPLAPSTRHRGSAASA